LEKTPEEHIEKLVIGFREVRRIMRDDAVLFLNYGDKYNAGRDGGWAGGKNSGFQQVDERYPNCSGPNVKGLKPGDLIGLAWRLALALQADGWYLRSDTIWAKALSFCEKYSGSTMPESLNGWRWERHKIKVKSLKRKARGNQVNLMPNRKNEKEAIRADINIPSALWQPCPGCPKCEPNGGLVLRKGSWRPTRAHEYLFILTKSRNYFCDMEAVREAVSENTHDRGLKLSPPIEAAGIGHKNFTQYCPEKNNPSGRNLRDVWVINPQVYSTYSETYHLERVSKDELSDGMMHIMSPNCPAHGGLFDLFAILDDDEREGEKLSRILRSDNYLVQVPPPDFLLTVQHRTYYFGQYNLDWLLRQCFPSAIDRNNESHKKALALLTNPSSKPSAQKFSRIVRKLVSHGLSEQGRNIFESNIWPDEMDARLLGQMIFRIVDKFSYRKLLNNDNCLCGFYQVKTEKSSHYATFPEALVEPCIKVATSQKGVCPKCGAQWARIVDSKQIKRYSPADRTDRHNQGKGVNSCGNTVAGVDTTTLGWRPTCNCGIKETEPAVVFDPFMGSGTVAAVAARLGRNYSGVELNPGYIKEQAKLRIAEAETCITIAEQKQGQMGLFEENNK